MKKTYYATKDIKGEVISKNAKICKFDSYKKMEAYLLEQFHEEDLKDHDVQIKIGEFGEFWIESYEKVHVGNQYIYSPFSYNQLYIDKFPASGKNCTWITPNHVEVYVAELVYND